MSKIMNDGLTRSGTECFIAVSIWQQWASYRIVSLTGNFVLDLINIFIFPVGARPMEGLWPSIVKTRRGLATIGSNWQVIAQQSQYCGADDKLTVMLATCCLC